MQIAIVAAGAVGGILGARLADAGHEVSVIARGKHLEAIRKDGLQIESLLGNTVLRPKVATDDPAEIGPVDIIIFAVKLWDTQTVAQACKPMMGPDTLVIPFQNGVESTKMIAEVLGDDHVMSGVAYISATISQPGHVRQNGEFANFILGAPGGAQPPALLTEFAQACQTANVNAVVVPNIEAQLWKKLVFFAAFSGINVAARCTLGDMRNDDALWRVFVAAMNETAAVAKASGITLDDDVVNQTLKTVEGMPDATRATMANDLLAGNKLEAYWLSGAVGRLGREGDVPTPVHDTFYAAARLFVNGAPA